MYESNTFLCKNYTILPIQTNGGANVEKSPKQPLPLGAHGPHSVHECLSQLHSPPQTTARSIHAFPHNYASKAPLVTIGCPKFTLKTAPSLQRSPLPSNTSILNRPHSPSPTASGSTQPFSTLQFADREIEIDRWSRRRLGNISTYARLIESDALIIIV